MFWRGKKVFLTGHTGFKGAWLTLWLAQMGAKVYGYSLAPPTSPSLFESARVAEACTSQIADINELATLRAAMSTAQPEIVIHMAAQSLVRRSYADPVETYRTNLLGTVHVLEAMRGCATVRAGLIVTTDKCYENLEREQPYRESDRLGGHDPYSNSKACAELATAAYRDSFFADSKVRVASARAGNVIGGGDWSEDRLVPDVMRAFVARQPIELRHPAAVRPWQFVLEPLRGYLQLAERLYADERGVGAAYNFGPDNADAKPVEWVVRGLAQRWGAGAEWKAQPGTHPHEAQTLKLDWSKAHAKLGWQPVVGIERALDLTAEWYKAFAGQQDMRAFTEKQIAAYSATMNEKSNATVTAR